MILPEKAGVSVLGCEDTKGHEAFSGGWFLEQETANPQMEDES